MFSQIYLSKVLFLLCILSGYFLIQATAVKVKVNINEEKTKNEVIKVNNNSKNENKSGTLNEKIISNTNSSSTKDSNKLKENNSNIPSSSNPVNNTSKSQEKKTTFEEFSLSFSLNFFSEIGDKSFVSIILIYDQITPMLLFLVASF